MRWKSRVQQHSMSCMHDEEDAKCRNAPVETQVGCAHSSFTSQPEQARTVYACFFALQGRWLRALQPDETILWWRLGGADGLWSPLETEQMEWISGEDQGGSAQPQCQVGGRVSGVGLSRKD